MSALIYVAVLCLGFVIAFAVYEVMGEPGGYGESPYKRRRFLMDSNAEFGLFKILVEIYGDRYYIFPQVHYSHLIEAGKHNWREYNRLMSRITAKSADFVLCKKDDVSPQLVIELDGPSHSHPKRRDRDQFIDAALNGTGLPILHIPVGPYTKESIREAVDTALAGK